MVNGVKRLTEVDCDDASPSSSASQEGILPGRQCRLYLSSVLMYSTSCGLRFPLSDGGAIIVSRRSLASLNFSSSCCLRGGLICRSSGLLPVAACLAAALPSLFCWVRARSYSSPFSTFCPTSQRMPYGGRHRFLLLKGPVALSSCFRCIFLPAWVTHLFTATRWGEWEIKPRPPVFEAGAIAVSYRLPRWSIVIIPLRWVNDLKFLVWNPVPVLLLALLFVSLVKP